MLKIFLTTPRLTDITYATGLRSRFLICIKRSQSKPPLSHSCCLYADTSEALST